MSFLRSKNLANSALKVENSKRKVAHCIPELNIFESNLSYLIISDIINIEIAKKLGFSDDYIRYLLSSSKEKVNYPYIEYSFNEQNGKTAKILENGKMLVLPYTPNAVIKKLRKEEYSNSQKALNR